MLMKIDSGHPVTAAQFKAARQGDSARPGGFAAHLGASSQRAVAGSVPLGPLGSLLALQEVADPLTGRRRARKRAEDLLDVLDEVRVGLLNGSMPRAVLGELARLAGEARDKVDDPGLSAILDEIDLRAQVELAKLEAQS